MNDFDIGRHIDSGKFGRVYLVRCRRTQMLCAMKSLSKRKAVEQRVERQVEREVNIHYNLRHANILRLFCYFYDRKKIYLVLEYAAKGNLYKHMRHQQPPRFREPVAAYYMSQICRAVQYLHKQCVIHRDIKPENMLLTLDNVVKLADFGWSVHCPQSSRRETFCGTLDYIAPEVVDSEEYDFGVDIWGIGVLLYELVAGVPPFDIEGEMKASTYRRIRTVEYTFPKHMSSDARDLIRGFLQRSAELRTQLEDALAHAWMQRIEKDPT